MIISASFMAVAELPIAIVSFTRATDAEPKAMTPSCSAFADLPIAIVSLAQKLLRRPLW